MRQLAHHSLQHQQCNGRKQRIHQAAQGVSLRLEVRCSGRISGFMAPDTLLPPESDQRFDIGSTADSLDRMRDLYARHGDAYRVYAPGRQSHTWVFNHPDDVRRILIAEPPQLHQGRGLRSHQDPARQRHHS